MIFLRGKLGISTGLGCPCSLVRLVGSEGISRSSLVKLLSFVTNTISELILRESFKVARHFGEASHKQGGLP